MDFEFGLRKLQAAKREAWNANQNDGLNPHLYPRRFDGEKKKLALCWWMKSRVALIRPRHDGDLDIERYA